MNCAEAVKRFAEWADLAGRIDIPIKVNATRRTLMSEASRTGIAIAPRIRGGSLPWRA